MRATRVLARGFTMVELLVVMAILGILAAAIMPLGEAIVKAQKERELRDALWEIRHAIDAYKRAADEGVIARADGSSGYPPSLQTLVEGAAKQVGSGNSQALYFLRRIPRDPFAPENLPDEQTWRLRSFASPPDNPQPGADVFDVQSSSDAVGLDGRPYAKW
jgi:general secretion pathway protein G